MISNSRKATARPQVDRPGRPERTKDQGDLPERPDRTKVEHEAPPRLKAVTRSKVDATPEWESLDSDLREGIEVVSAVLPFRTNRYVMEELIDWNAVPDDPILPSDLPASGHAHARAVRSDP